MVHAFFFTKRVQHIAFPAQVTEIFLGLHFAIAHTGIRSVEFALFGENSAEKNPFASKWGLLRRERLVHTACSDKRGFNFALAFFGLRPR